MNAAQVIPIERKRRKKKPTLTADHRMAFDMWNQLKPAHWVKVLVPNSEKTELWDCFHEECTAMEKDPFQIFSDGLEWARQDKWSMKSDVRLQFQNFMRKERNLCLTFAERWQDLQERQQEQEREREEVKASEVRIRIERPVR
jgi:hypothetical protein